MKRHTIAKFSVVLALAVLALCFSQSTASADTVITLLNPPQDGVLTLAPGESYTFEVLVESDTPFVHAAAFPDPYYPGRGVFFSKPDQANGGTSAVLHVTITGKNSTADLPGGYAPISLMVGARFKGGLVSATQFDFQVFVP